jgi:hypothetical protein
MYSCFSVSLRSSAQNWVQAHSERRKASKVSPSIGFQQLVLPLRLGRFQLEQP